MNFSRRTLLSGIAIASIPAHAPTSPNRGDLATTIPPNRISEDDFTTTPNVALSANEPPTNGALGSDWTTNSIPLRTIPAALMSFVTSGFAVSGDGGQCLIERINEPNIRQPWHYQDKMGGWFSISENQEIYPEMFGAKADPSIDDWLAFNNALNFTNCLYIRGRNYHINAGLPIKRFQSIVSNGGPVNSNAGGPIMPAGARLIFGGKGQACFYNRDPQHLISHGGMYGLTIKVIGDYKWIWDFNECVSWRWQNIEATVDASKPTISILRSKKIINSNPSWLNQIINCNFILPPNSVGVPMDQDWSDSVIDGNSLSGGIGSIERSYGNKYTNNNIERAVNGAGLTLKKQERGAGSMLMNNFFDANHPYGLVIDVDDDPTDNQEIFHVLSGNKFRTIHALTGKPGVADIYLKPHPTKIYSGGIFCLNTHDVAAVNPLQYDYTKWNKVVAGPMQSRYAKAAAFDYNSLDTTTYSGYHGINIPAGIVCVRGSFSQFGMPNVSGYFGGNYINPAGVQLGAMNGTQPFIAASRRIDNTATDLLIYTDATERLRLHSHGAYLRPASDGAMSLGTNSNRVAQLFAATPTISTSDQREKEEIGSTSSEVLDAWGDVQWVQFKFKEAIQKKGSEARIHTGLIAQQILEVFDAHGLDALKYGLLCYNEWEDQYESITGPIHNKEGEYEFHDTGERRLVMAAGSRYGVRYEEAQAIEAAFQRRQIARLEKKLADLTMQLERVR